MAQLILGAAGAAIPGAGIFGAVGGSAVGYEIDQSGILDWWYPYKVLKKLFGPEPVVGPRVNDLRVTTASEGSPRNFVVGTGRCNATLIWANKLKEVKDDQGGKGGSAEFTEYKYYSDCAYYICDGPVKEVKRLLLDGKTVYAKNLAVNVSGITADGVGKQVNSNFNSQTGYYWVSVYQRLYIETGGDPVLEDELNLIQPGQKIKILDLPFVAGATYSQGQIDVFNAEHTVWKSYEAGEPSGGFGKKLIYVTVWEGTNTEWANFQSTVGGTGKPYWVQDGVVLGLFQAVSLYNGKVAKAISVKLGGPNQQPDSLIESIEGPDIPGFRGSCIVRFTQMYVGDFANRPPVLEAIVDSGKGKTVAQAIKRICTKYASIPEGLVNVHNSVNAANGAGDFAGMNIEGNVGLHDALAPLMAVYNLIPYDDEGVLTFRSRLHPLTRTIDALMMPGLTVDQVTTRDAPTTLTVEFIDPEHGWQRATRRARMNDVKNNVSDQVSTGMVLTGKQAFEMALRMLWDVHQSGVTYKMALPPSQLKAVPTELITFEGIDRTWTGAILDIDQGADLTSQVNAKEEDLEVLDQSYIADFVEEDPPLSATKMFGDDFYSDPIIWEAIDVGPLQDEDVDVCGVYFAACSTNRAFKGAWIYESSDSCRTWVRIGRVPRSAIMGTVLSKTAYSGNHLGYDKSSVITIELFGDDMQPGSVEFASMLAGRNTWYSHGEVFGAANCSLVGKNTYELSDMARGLRGTEGAIDQLDVGDTVVMLGYGGVYFQRLNPTAMKTERFYKLVGDRAPLELVTPRRVSFDGGTLLPMSVCSVRGTRDGANNLTITWKPRTRDVRRTTQGRRFGQERYQLSVGGGVRRVRVDDAREYVYTAAQQVQDGLTPGDPVTVIIFQMSDVVGRGRPRTVVL